MQEDVNCIVLMKVDFLMHEKEFDALRNFVSELDFTDVKLFDEFDYNMEEDKVILIHQPIHPDYSNLDLIYDKTQDGYIVLDLNSLKRFVAL